MVTIQAMRSSNSLIASSLPPRLVAVFVGATAGIGEASLKQFATHARQPRIYFVGRTQKFGDRITAECKTLNPDGEYIFLRADVSLIRNVDDVCRKITEKENMVNILFMSQGSLDAVTQTSENLPLIVALTYYSRMRFIVNLLSLLEQATVLRRVVSVFAGGKEGPIDPSDIPGRHVSLLSGRGHVASLLTFGLEVVAREAPTVTFIHSFPGAVKTNLGDTLQGVSGSVIRGIFRVLGPFMFTSIEECGECHLFFATSARYTPTSANGAKGAGVPLVEGVVEAAGTDGKNGSGVYTIGSDGEAAGPKVEKLLLEMRNGGMVDKVWQHTESEFKRIVG